MSSFRLAVDYGTSTTVAFLRWPDGRVRPLLFDDSPLLPSAVYLEPDGRLLTGRDAVRSARFEPGRFEANPKRRIDDGDVLLGDRVLPVEDLIAATLARVLEEATRIAAAQPAAVTLTHPVAWGERRRTTLVRAAVRAGLPPVELLPEPVAAATAFATVLGHAVPPGSSVVVYDLGAGTFDVSVVRRDAAGFSTLASDGLVDVGGLDLDAVVVDLVRRASRADNEALWYRLMAPSGAAEQLAARELWDGAREAKEALSRRASVPVVVPGLPAPQHVTREELEAAARPVLTQTVSVTMGALRNAGPVAGLFLVGGSTRVPLVASMLHRATGIAPTVIEQPEMVVAEGALHATAAPPSSPPLPRSGSEEGAPTADGRYSGEGATAAGAGGRYFGEAATTATGSTGRGPATATATAGSRSFGEVAATTGEGDRHFREAATAAMGLAGMGATATAVTGIDLAPEGHPGPPRKRRLGASLVAAGAAAVTLAVLLAVLLWPQGQRGASGDTPGITGVGAHPSSGAASPAGAGPGGSASATASPSAGTKASPTRRATASPATRPTGPVTVSAALVKTRLAYNGPCPPPGNTAIQLTVDFTTSGPTKIDYYWKSDPGWDPDINNLSMTVSKAGTTRANGGFYGGWDNTPGTTISYWVQLVVTKPISYTSEKVTWSTTCTTVS